MTRAIVAWLATACLASCGDDGGGAGLDSGTEEDSGADVDSETDPLNYLVKA
jgi:hypothetical protein